MSNKSFYRTSYKRMQFIKSIYISYQSHCNIVTSQVFKLHFREISTIFRCFFHCVFLNVKSYWNPIRTLCLLLHGCQYIDVWTTDVLENMFLESKLTDVKFPWQILDNIDTMFMSRKNKAGLQYFAMNLF